MTRGHIKYAHIGFPRQYQGSQMQFEIPAKKDKLMISCTTSGVYSSAERDW